MLTYKCWWVLSQVLDLYFLIQLLQETVDEWFHNYLISAFTITCYVVNYKLYLLQGLTMFCKASSKKHLQRKFCLSSRGRLLAQSARWIALSKLSHLLINLVNSLIGDERQEHGCFDSSLLKLQGTKGLKALATSLNALVILSFTVWYYLTLICV